MYKRDIYRKLKLPIKISVVFISFTFLLYLFGPIKWNSKLDFTSLVMIILIFLYILAFHIGYMDSLKKKKIGKINIKNNRNRKVIKFLNYFVYINFIFILLNALQYSNTSNILTLMQRAIDGLNNPNAVYYQKLINMRLYGAPNSLLTYTTVFLAFILFPTLVLSIYYFNRINIFSKFIVIFTIIIEFMRWFALGTNKGIFDITILLIVVYFVKHIRKIIAKKDYRQNIKILLIVIVGFLFLFVFFGYTISSRLNGYYSLQTFQSFPYNLTPEFMRVFIERFTSYLTQGYNGMYYALKYESWTPMFGVGNSRFLISVIERIFDVDIFKYTYAAKLEIYGLDPLATWHTAFSWFANDISFIGVIFLMYIVGRFFANIFYESVFFENPISLTLLYLLIMGILNVSGTNYLLAYSNGFMAFWQLVLIRFVLRKYQLK